MKTLSIGRYVGTMGNIVLEQQTFIKKLLDTLQLLQPQSKEFTYQLNQLKEEYEKAINNQNLESNENLTEFDSVTSQIQKDLENIHVQLRVLKSANASSRKGQGQPDLTAIEKNKKLKQSFKEYKTESSQQITDIKSEVAELKNELKNSHELMTNIQANIQASRDEFDSFRSKVPTQDEREEMDGQVNDIQDELEAIKAALELMHQGAATTKDLEKMKKSQIHSVNILKNSMQNVKDEINNIKLLKQGKMPQGISDLVDKLDNSVNQINSLQDDMKDIKQDVDNKSSILTQAQQDLNSLITEVEKLKQSSFEIDTSSLPLNDRINLIENRINEIADSHMKAVKDYNAQKTYLQYIKDEFANEITERVSDLEKRMDELPLGDANASDQKKQTNEEYQHLDQKLEQMIQDLETSNIQERAINTSGEKPDFPHTVEELRTFQKALRAQALDDEQSIYQYIEPSNLPLVVQSMDQLLNEMYSEIYQIRDRLTNEISELRESSNSHTIRCLKHEIRNMKRCLNGLQQQAETVSREIDLNQSETMQWPVLRSPGKKKEPSPYFEGLKTKIESLVEDMNNAEGQEDEDINQIKPTMGEAQAKLNNMLTVCNNIMEQEPEDEIEQITPEKMWETINELKGKVSSMEEEKQAIRTREIQLEEEEADEVKKAIEELRNSLEQIQNQTETQDALGKIDEQMNSLTERINQVSGHQTVTDNTIGEHSTKINQHEDQIQEKLKQVEELEQTLNDFVSSHHENDDQSIANMKSELEELKNQLTNINQMHEESGNTLNSQISEINQKLKEFEEGAFFKSSPRANPIVQELQRQIAELIKQMEDSQLKDEEDTTGELRPTFSQAQEQLETVQKTLDEILAQENERLMMENPSELVKNVQNLNNKVKILEEGLQQRGGHIFEELQQRSFSEEEAAPTAFNTQTRAIDLTTTDANEKPSELVYELMNRIQILEHSVKRLNEQHQAATNLIDKRHKSLKKVKQAVNENVNNRLVKIEDDLNHHISDHPVSQGIQVAVSPDSYVKSKPNPAIESLKQQIDDLIQKIQTEELENLATTELNESGSHLKPELDQLKDQLSKLQETLRKLQEQQIYVPAAESLQGISDTISILQDKLNNQSKMIRELKDQSDIKNNESINQLKEEIKSLKNQVKTTLQNEENLTNEVQDRLLPITQKIESLERQIDGLKNNGDNNFQESNIPLVERSVSDIYTSGSPRRMRSGNMNSIEALKTSIDQFVEKIDDEKLNEEEDTTGELHNNLGQTRKDLANLQNTLNTLLRKANDPAFLQGVNEDIHNLQNRVSKLEQGGAPVYKSRNIQLNEPNGDELNQLKQDVERLNTENEELKRDLKSIKYELKQLSNKAPSVQEEEEEIDIINDDNNNNKDINENSVGLLKQELDDLRDQLRNLNDKDQKMQDQINQLIRENTSGFFSSTQPKRKQRSKAVSDIKDSVDNLLTEMNDPNIQEEAGDSEDLKPSMDQAQEDLEKLQITLNSILTQPHSDAEVLTPEDFYKLVKENQEEIRAIAQNGEMVNKNLCSLTETVRCIKHEMRKLKNIPLDQSQSGFDSLFRSSTKTREANPTVLQIQSQIDVLSKQLDESDLTENDTKERDLNGKVTQTQENLKSLREALQSILDQDESEEITPDNLIQTIRDLRAQGILFNQEIKNSQNNIHCLKYEIKKIKDAQTVKERDIQLEPEETFEERITQSMDSLKTRIDEVSGNQIKTEENVRGQLTRLRDYKNEIDQVRNELSEIKEMLSSAEEWMCITDQTKPEDNKASPLVESLTQQIDKLVEDLNKPDMQSQTTNNEDLEERRTQAQTQLSLLREALERAKEAQQHQLSFTPTSLLEAIKDLRTRVEYIEFNDAQKVQSRDIVIEEEEEENDGNRIPPAKGFPERNRNPVIDDINQRIDSLVQTLHHPDMENVENEELRPPASSTENELRVLRRSLDFLQRQQEEMDLLTPENLYKAICNLQVTAIRFEEAISSISCLKHEVKKLRQIELNNTNQKLLKLKQKSKDVKKKLNDHLEENQRILNEINSPRKKRSNPAIEEVKREIETLNAKMNDPSFAEQEENDNLTSGELSSRKQQAQQHLELLSETLTKLLEQEEPAILNVDTLHQMIHDLQAKVAFLEAQAEQTTKEQQEKISNLETKSSELQGFVDEFKNQQQTQQDQENEIENRVSQLEQTVESMEEVNTSIASITEPLIKSTSKKPNSRAEELKNQIDILFSQMDDLSIDDDNTKDELNPAMDKAKDELTILRNLLQRFNENEGFSPLALMQLTQGLDSRVKALEEDKVNHIQTREINLESEEKVNTLSESFDTLKSSLDTFQERLGNAERNEEEIQKNVEEVCKQIEDINSRLGEVESQPSQIFAGFNSFKKRPINPSMEALQNRIDEIRQQMKEPELQDEEDNSNSKLKPTISKAEAELGRLQETLRRLMQQEEPVAITPETLHALIHELQAKVTELEVLTTENQEATNNQINAIQENQKDLVSQFNEKISSMNDLLQSTQDSFQGIENKVDDHIENHPVPEAQWTVEPREASPQIQQLKKMIDEICENMHAPDLDENNEDQDEIKPNIENAETELKQLQQKVNEILEEQKQPPVLTPDRIYQELLDIKSTVAKIRKEQIQQRAAAAQIKERSAEIEFEEEEEEAEPFTTTTNKNASIRDVSKLQNDVEHLKSFVADIRSQLRNQQKQNLSSLTKDYNDLKQAYPNGLPKTEIELVSYISRLEKIAKGFDDHIVDAQREMKKIEEIKKQIKDDGEFAKSLQSEIRSQSSAIRCIKHELRNLKSANSQLGSIKSRDISLILDNDNENQQRVNSPRRRRSIRNNNNRPTEEEANKELQERLSKIENRLDSFQLQYRGFERSQEEENALNNSTAAYEALSSSINKFIERNVDQESDDEEVEKLQPDIETNQIKLKALKGSIDDKLHQQRQNELAVVTPQTLNADIIDVRKHVEKTEKDINEINDKIDLLDENQEQAVQSFNVFKNEVDNSPKVTQEILDYIDDLPNQLSQIKSEIALLQEAKEAHQNELARINQSINELTEEDKKLSEEIKQNHDEVKQSIQQHQEENVQQFNEVKQTIQQNQDENAQQLKGIKQTIQQNQDENAQQFNQVKSTIRQNQEQNEQQFSQVKSTVQRNQEENAQQINQVKQTIQRNQEENAQQLNEVKQNVSRITNDINEVKSTVQRIQDHNTQQFNEIKSTIRQHQEENTQQFNEMNSAIQQHQEENAQQFNEIKSTIQQHQEENTQQFNEMNSAIQQHQEENAQQFNEIKSTVQRNQDEINSTIQQHQEENNQQFNEVKETIQQNQEENTKQLNNLNSTVQKNQEENNQQFNDLRENTENLTQEIANLKASLKSQEETLKNEKELERKMINSQSKNIEYIQKVMTKHDKNLKALNEKQKGMEDMFQQNDPVSKDSFQKLEMKYDKLIEQIHSNILVIANGQQSQHETIRKEINNLSQGNSELQSENSLGATSNSHGIDDLNKKMAKIFKHVKSQDEKINKLRSDVDGILNA